MSFTIAKFGGSSVRDADAMRRCARIVRDRPEIGMVIISATYNTTNQLEEIARLANEGKANSADTLLCEMLRRHRVIAEELGAELEIDLLDHEAKALCRGKIGPEQMDALYSIGERLSSALFSCALKKEVKKAVQLLDIRPVLKTDSQFGRARPRPEKIKPIAKERLFPLLGPETIVVGQGFIGSDETGRTTTLGREGSDYSATLLGEALGAQAVQIWTDVNGISTCDPKLLSSVHRIPHLSYDEASCMARKGAKVLFEDTLLPAKRADIPVQVLSSHDPCGGGTLIDRSGPAKRNAKGIAVQFVVDSVAISVVGEELEALNLPGVVDKGELFQTFHCRHDELTATLERLHDRLFSE